jgi:flagellar motor switch protein FliN/FliY
MIEPNPSQARVHEFEEVVPLDAALEDHLDFEDLKKIRLNITADLGEAKMSVREVLELREGSVIPFDKLAGEMTDVEVNGIPLAKGEIVVIADTLHVRVSEIIGAIQEEKDLGEE